MNTPTVHFDVRVKDLVITSGAYVTADLHGTSAKHPFQGNSFQVSGPEDYFAVTVFIHSYELRGVEHHIKDRPIALLATCYQSSIVKVCPESTIASIYAFARMITVHDDGTVHLKGTARNLKIAYGMKQNIFRTAGEVGDMIRQSPNGFETNSYAMFNSLCNLFYYCLTDVGIYDQFLGYVAGSSFLQGMRNILRDPFHNADRIYHLIADKKEIYAYSLVSMNVADARKIPDQWTLTLKTNSSGSKNFIPSGAAFVVFDADDNAWVANNFRAGAGDSGTHCPVYKYNATPADFSPVQGGGLLGVAFGAAVDPGKKYISFGNFGWGSQYNNPQEGSISRFYYKDGRPVSPSNGFTPGLSRVQGMNYDTAGHLWMASVGCQEPFAPAPDGVYPFKSAPSAVVVYMNGDPENVVICDEFPVKHHADDTPLEIRTPYLKIFDVVPDNKGNAYVSCIGNYDKDVREHCAVSAVYKVAMEHGKLVVKHAWYSDFYSDINKHRGFESLRQLAINAVGDVIVVGVSSSRATIISHDLATVKGYYDVNTYAPWGVKIDQQGSVFLANFGHETEPTAFGVTLVRDPLKPETAKLMTVPTGGDEVTLANGHPLYGLQPKGGIRIKCYQPIMRLTSTNIDGAGNLWCMNNWKPAAVVDVKENPGGDGVVIFLGIAEPE